MGISWSCTSAVRIPPSFGAHLNRERWATISQLFLIILGLRENSCDQPSGDALEGYKESAALRSVEHSLNY